MRDMIYNAYTSFITLCHSLLDQFSHHPYYSHPYYGLASSYYSFSQILSYPLSGLHHLLLLLLYYIPPFFPFLPP